MKTCNDCNSKLNNDQFNWRSKAEGTKQPYCRECQRNRNRKDYYDNKSDRKEKIKQSRERGRLESRMYIFNHLSSTPCIVCGESRVACLQFDHRNPSEKSHNVSRMIGFGLDKIKQEIAKCDVRCANCHALRTAEQFNWYKFAS